jgi:hypothetical protein
MTLQFKRGQSAKAEWSLLPGYSDFMKKLFRNIRAAIIILEIIWAVLGAVLLIFNKFKLVKNIYKNQKSTSASEEDK